MAIRLIYLNSDGFYVEGSDADELTIGTVSAQGVGGVAFNANSNRIIGVSTPLSANDAANKAYVDSLKAGFVVKTPVRVATTEPITTATYSAGTKTLSGMPLVVDGVTLTNLDRVLVKDQKSGNTANDTTNGIYYVSNPGTGTNGIWIRADDFNSSEEVIGGASVFVNEGMVNKDSTWVLITDNPTLDVSPLEFVQYNGVGSLSVDDQTLSKQNNKLSVIGLPLPFNVGGSQVTTASAAALNAVTGGASSNASLYHRHNNAASGSDGFMSAADKAKLDGIASGATNTPLTSTAPQNVLVQTAAAGISTEAARADHKHNVSVGTPVAIADSSNSAGTATSLARSDHVHAHGNRGGGSLHAAVVASTGGIGGANGFMTAEDKEKLDGIAPGATNTPLSNTAAVGLAPNSTAAAGSSTSAARADHVHSLAMGTPVEITDSTNSAGTANSLARSDHQHAHGDRGGGSLHAVATTTVAGFMSAADKVKLNGIATGATNTPLSNTAAQTVGTANTVGTSTTAARADHVHAHGNQPGGSLHAAVSAFANGFMTVDQYFALSMLTDPEFHDAHWGENIHKHSYAGGSLWEHRSHRSLELISWGVIGAGDCVCVASDGRVRRADNTDDNLCRVVGVAFAESPADGEPAYIVTHGPVDAGSSLTPGKVVYLGVNAQVTHTAPTGSGNHVVEVGIAIDTDRIFVSPRYVAKRP